jgi:hypothetical protein
MQGVRTQHIKEWHPHAAMEYRAGIQQVNRSQVKRAAKLIVMLAENLN